jgi:CRISPR-associated endonuclease/helicase Cas3
MSGAGAGTRLTLLTSHPDMGRLLSRAAAMTGLPFGSAPALRDVVVESTWRTTPQSALAQWATEADDLVRSVPPAFLAAAKALVLAADVAGSALPRCGEQHDWIASSLQKRLDSDRAGSVVRARLGASPLRPFQSAVAASEAPLTLVRAGCGSGKTAAAYAWYARQHVPRQLWVTYPTTGTTTEGYRDYVHPTSVEGRLEHSRAATDLELFGLTGESDGQREIDRLEALRAWEAETVTATVDTVLGLVQNQRRGLYAFPALAYAAIVFDEIHAYDEPLFGALERFLEAMPGTPALLMTASLPTSRLARLRELSARIHGRPLHEIEGPPDLEQFKRYRRTLEDPWQCVTDAMGGGGKVLWVCNTVTRCLAVAETARARGLEPLVYHSRFRYCDRVRRHRDLVDAFRSPGPALAVTTQVAEISLDLSADLLVSDAAPVPALIQRLGRLNRRSTPDAPQGIRPFVLVPFEGRFPYAADELAEGSRWLSGLGSADLSQRDLVETWEGMGAGDTAPAPTSSAWLDGGFDTAVAPLRAGAPGITVLLSSDIGHVRAGRSAAEYALPMPPPPARLGRWQDWHVVQWLPVPPEGTVVYDERLGARWKA